MTDSKLPTVPLPRHRRRERQRLNQRRDRARTVAVPDPARFGGPGPAGRTPPAQHPPRSPSWISPRQPLPGGARRHRAAYADVPRPAPNGAGALRWCRCRRGRRFPVARPGPRPKGTTAPGKPAPCVSRASPDPSAGPCGLEPGHGAFADQLPRELGQRCEDAEHEAAGRSGGVDLRALALPVPQISLAGLVNHPNSSRSSKAKAMATSWV